MELRTNLRFGREGSAEGVRLHEVLGLSVTRKREIFRPQYLGLDTGDSSRSVLETQLTHSPRLVDSAFLNTKHLFLSA